MTKRQVNVPKITREEMAMAKRLRDSRKAEAEYDLTLDPRQRFGANYPREGNWEDHLGVPAFPSI